MEQRRHIPGDNTTAMTPVNRTGAPAPVDGVNPPGEVAGVEGEAQGFYLTDQELLSIVRRELDSSLGWTGSRLAEARRNSLSRYFANPRGDEREGYSSVVTRDTFEVVEWIMPDMMEIFTAANEVARFEANNARQEQGADQATDACNAVFYDQNGFEVLYNMFKDAFIQKSGTVKVMWDDTIEWNMETYEGKLLMELTGLLEDPNFEFQAVDAYVEENGEQIPIDLDNAPPGLDINGLFFDVEGRRGNRTGRVALVGVPPEEFVINRDARSDEESDPTLRFIGHRTRTTESELIALGIDPEIAHMIPSSSSAFSTDADAVVRASQDDSAPQVFSYRSDSERTIYVLECYVKADRDGDGISEWWKVLAGGEYGQVLLTAEQVGGHPFASVTPIPIPHRFYGLSLADVTDDITDINTTLWRQYLNSLYLSTSPRNIVLTQGGGTEGEAGIPQANLDQLLNVVPGGYVEEYQPNSIRPMETRDAAPHVLPALELHEKARTNRTGISPESQGIDPQAISKHVFGAMMQTTAAMKRTALYARIFANTGVRRLFELIYKTLLQNQTQEYMIKLRGKWVPVDPTSWAHDYRCKVNVGLGHGSRLERGMNVQTIMEVQKAMADAGLTNIVDASKVYNSASVLTESLGFRDTSQFFDDPSTKPPPQPDPSPEELAIEAQQQIEIMKLEIERQKVEVDRYKAMIQAKKNELDHEAAIYKLRLDGYTVAKMDDAEGGASAPLPPPPPEAPTPVPQEFVSPATMTPPGGGMSGPMDQAFANYQGGMA